MFLKKSQIKKVSKIHEGDRYVRKFTIYKQYSPTQLGVGNRIDEKSRFLSFLAVNRLLCF